MKAQFLELMGKSALDKAREDPETVLEIVNRDRCTQESKLPLIEEAAQDDPALLQVIKAKPSYLLQIS